MLAREIVDETIVLDEGTVLIPSVSRNYQLLQKAETFVSRKMMKTRDAFDMRLLLAEGAVLDEALKAHLNDLVLWRELDAEQIKERIEQITPKLCRAELKSVLPEEVYSSLEVEEFESLRAAVRTLFAEERSTLWTGQLHFEKRRKDRLFCGPTILRIATASANPPSGTHCAGKNDAGS